MILSWARFQLVMQDIWNLKVPMPLQKACGPCFLLPLVLHLFKSLFLESSILVLLWCAISLGWFTLSSSSAFSSSWPECSGEVPCWFKGSAAWEGAWSAACIGVCIEPVTLLCPSPFATCAIGTMSTQLVTRLVTMKTQSLSSIQALCLDGGGGTVIAWSHKRPPKTLVLLNSYMNS